MTSHTKLLSKVNKICSVYSKSYNNWINYRIGLEHNTINIKVLADCQSPSVTNSSLLPLITLCFLNYIKWGKQLLCAYPFSIFVNQIGNSFIFKFRKFYVHATTRTQIHPISNLQYTEKCYSILYFVF